MPVGDMFPYLTMLHPGFGCGDDSREEAAAQGERPSYHGISFMEVATASMAGKEMTKAMAKFYLLEAKRERSYGKAMVKLASSKTANFDGRCVCRHLYPPFSPGPGCAFLCVLSIFS